MDIKVLRYVIAKNSPAILTGIAVTGVISTTVLGIRATPKAMDIIKEASYVAADEPGVYDLIELTGKEKAQLTWKLYLPVVVMGSITIASILGAQRINTKRTEALVGLYALSDSALKKYQQKVVENLGEKKDREVRDEIAKDELKANPVSSNEIFITGSGETLCYDSLSGRYFKSDIEKIRQAVNKLSRDLLTDHFITLNDLYYELGLIGTSLGDKIGWHLDDGLVDVNFSSQLTEEGQPCLVMEFNMPRWGYDD